MRFTSKLAALAFALTLLLPNGTFAAHAKPSLFQDEAVVTSEEREEVQAFARRVVARMLETRDVAPLIDEFFQSNFTSFFRQDFYEKVSPQLYEQLSEEEKVRLFVAQENLSYMITLEVMSAPESERGSDRPSFTRFLPDEIAHQLNKSRLVEGDAKFTDHGELLKELAELEKALAEARRVLVWKGVELSPEFQKRFKLFETDENLGYRVRDSVFEEDVKGPDGQVRFTAGQKLFRVETPILIGLLLVKEGGALKILALAPADDD